MVLSSGSTDQLEARDFCVLQDVHQRDFFKLFHYFFVPDAVIKFPHLISIQCNQMFIVWERDVLACLIRCGRQTNSLSCPFFVRTEITFLDSGCRKENHFFVCTSFLLCLLSEEFGESKWGEGKNRRENLKAKRTIFLDLNLCYCTKALDTEREKEREKHVLIILNCTSFPFTFSFSSFFIEREGGKCGFSSNFDWKGGAGVETEAGQRENMERKNRQLPFFFVILPSFVWSTIAGWALHTTLSPSLTSPLYGKREIDKNTFAALAGLERIQSLLVVWRKRDCSSTETDNAMTTNNTLICFIIILPVLSHRTTHYNAFF